MGATSQMKQVSQNLNINQQTPPPLPGTTYQYYAAINNQQSGPFDYSTICNMIVARQIIGTTLIWRVGLSGWEPISNQIEFSTIFASCPPPLPPL